MTAIELTTGTAAQLLTPTNGSAARRGLVLWPDVFGCRPLFVDHAQRLADQHRWNVVVVEPYPGQTELSVEQRLATAGQLNDDAKLADSEAAADACQVEPVGVMGFCMGGMWTMKAMASARFDRAVAFYGMIRLPPHWAGPRMGDAIDVVASHSSTELLAIFGTNDPWCPIEHIDELEALGRRVHVVRYPGADHGWAQDPARDNYRPEDAADAWRRAESFLATGATPTRV